MKELRLGVKIIKTLVKDQALYSSRLLVELFTLTARCVVLLLLYHYVFLLKGGGVGGVTYPMVAWSLFFYFAFSTFRLREVSKTIMRDVQSGAVEMLFNKPISYLRYRVWWQIGFGIYPFLITTAAGSLLLAGAVGIPPTMKIGIFIPTLFLILLGSSILALSIYLIVGLLSFWIEDINPVFCMVDKAVMILGGSYLPVALFPPFLYKLALYSPFGASQFVTHTAYPTWQLEWAKLLGIQAIWSVVLIGIVGILFARAREKLSVNGG
ncbi:ABC-2 family transporter protein [Patescibacteria group bacterium]|nr:ABC-2 family transporter protein [Patescibacteria group bacterium]